MTQSLDEVIAAAERAIGLGGDRDTDALSRVVAGVDLTTSDGEQRAYLAVLLHWLGLHEDAARCLGQGSDDGRPDGQDAALLRNLQGVLDADRGDYGGALQKFWQALAACPRRSPDRGKILANMAAASLLAGDLKESSRWLAAAERKFRRVDDPAAELLLASVRLGLARMGGSFRDFRAAAASFAHASKARIAQLGSDHPQALVVLATLAAVEFELATLDDSADHRLRAITVLEIAARRISAELGSDNPLALRAASDLSVAEIEMAVTRGSPAEVQLAVAALESVSRRAELIMGASHPTASLIAANVAQVKQQGRERAAPYRRPAIGAALAQAQGPARRQVPGLRAQPRLSRSYIRSAVLWRQLSKSLRALAAERGISVRDLSADTGQWSEEAIQAYLTGRSQPQWNFVLAFLDRAVSGDEQLRDRLEQRLWTEWTEAAGAQPRKRAASSRGRAGTFPELGHVTGLSTWARLRVPAAAALALLMVATGSLAVGERLARSHATRFSSASAPTILAPEAVFLTSDRTSAQAVAFSPDGRYLAVGDAGGAVELWNLTANKLAAKLNGLPGKGITSIAFSPDGKTLAAADRNGDVYSWQSATGRPRIAFSCVDRTVIKHSVGTRITDVTFSSTGSIIAATAVGSRAFACLSPAPAHTSFFTLRKNSKYPAIITAMNFSQYQTTLAIGSTVGMAYLFDRSRGVQFRLTSSLSAQGSISSIAFSPSNKILALAASNGVIRLSNPMSLRQINLIFADPGKSMGINSVAFSPDGKLLVAADGNGSTYIHRVSTGKLVSVLANPASEGVNAVAFSPGGSSLATADLSGATYLWSSGPRHRGRRNKITVPKAQSQATTINTVLVNSAQSRSQFNANVLVTNVGNCVAIDSDITQIGAIAHQRQTELTQVGNLQVGAIANGSTLKSQLMTALQISLSIDNDYLAWARQQQSSGCAVGTNSPYYQEAANEDSQATADKETFLRTWDPIASTYGLEQFDASQI